MQERNIKIAAINLKSNKRNKEFEQKIAEIKSRRNQNSVYGSGITFENSVQNNEELREILVKCPGCGARNSIIEGHTANCEYCGSKIVG